MEYGKLKTVYDSSALCYYQANSEVAEFLTKALYHSNQNDYSDLRCSVSTSYRRSVLGLHKYKKELISDDIYSETTGSDKSRERFEIER